MDLSVLPNKTLNITGASAPLKATENQDVSVTVGESAPLSSSVIVVTSAPIPTGYIKDELYTKFNTVSAIEHHVETATIEDKEDESTAGIDALNRTLATKLSENTYGSYASISGIYSQIGSFLDSGLETLEQTSSNSIYQSRIKNFDPASHIERSIESRTKGINTSLMLETLEGDKLTFDIELDYTRGKLAENAGLYASRNIKIAINLDGELSPAEKKAIEEFAKKLEIEVQNALEKNKGIDFSNLNIFKDDLIMNVSFDVKSGGSSQTPFKLKLSNSDNERVIEFNFKGGALSLNLDKHTPYAGNHNSAQAVETLLDSIKDGGGGKPLASATRALFDNLDYKQSDQPTKQSAKALLSGLHDFNINFSSSGQSNQLNVFQKTNVEEGKELDFKLTQQYQYDLKKEYLKPLPHLKSPDLKYGNYISVSEHEFQNHLSILETNKMGEYIDASIYKEASETVTEREFNDGELVRDETRRRTAVSYQNLVEEMRIAEENDKLLLVEGILEHLDYD